MFSHKKYYRWLSKVSNELLNYIKLDKTEINIYVMYKSGVMKIDIIIHCFKLKFI